MSSHGSPPQPPPGHGLVHLASLSDSGKDKLMVGQFFYGSAEKISEVFSFCCRIALTPCVSLTGVEGSQFCSDAM